MLRRPGAVSHRLPSVGLVSRGVRSRASAAGRRDPAARAGCAHSHETPPSADARAPHAWGHGAGRHSPYPRSYGAVTSEDRSGSTLAGPPTPAGGGRGPTAFGVSTVAAHGV